MKLVDIKILKEKSNLAIFIAPTIISDSLLFSNDEVMYSSKVSFDFLEDYCKKDIFQQVLKLIDEGNISFNFSSIMIRNLKLFKQAKFLDIGYINSNAYSMDSYQNYLDKGDLNGHNLSATGSVNEIIKREWPALFYDNFQIAITAIGGIITDKFGHSEILYINGVKKENLKLALVTRGVYGVSMLVNSKYQTFFNKLYKKYDGRMFPIVEPLDMTGAIRAFAPRFTPNNYDSIIKEITEAIVETYKSELPAKTLEHYNKIGIKDYVLDFGEEKVEVDNQVIVNAPTAPIIEETIDLASFLQNAGVVDSVENAEESIDSDILSYINQLNLDDSQQTQVAEERATSLVEEIRRGTR